MSTQIQFFFIIVYFFWSSLSSGVPKILTYTILLNILCKLSGKNLYKHHKFITDENYVWYKNKNLKYFHDLNLINEIIVIKWPGIVNILFSSSIPFTTISPATSIGISGNLNKPLILVGCLVIMQNR